MILGNRHKIAGGAAAIFGAAMWAGTASADFVILDDLIVDGSACIGFDCVDGEAFGFDTLRLKENNLRLHFQDTSNAASFPTTDWRIVINSSSNGGASFFAVDEVDTGRRVFRLDAGAPANALTVDSGGDVGIGRLNAVTDLHIRSGNTPTLRLEQDGSSGFTPQTWDVAGNEANFFIRDATSGSTLPFRIRPGAPTSAIDIEATTGDVGFGMSSPSAPIHVRRTDTTAKILVEDTNIAAGQRRMLELINAGTGGLAYRMTTNGVSIDTVNQNNQYRVDFIDRDPQELNLTANGDLTITGEITTSGSCSVGCDRVFDADYELQSIAEHADVMWQNRHLPAVGLTPEAGPYNLTEKMTGMLNELEKAHIYIEQLNKRLEALTKTLDSKG